MDAKEQYKLTATYEVNFPSEILVNRPKDDNMTYKLSINEFEVSLKLIVEDGWSSQLPGEPYITFGIGKILISLTRGEEFEPPPIVITPEGHRDFSQRAQYFSNLMPVYETVAQEVTERAILYFKYELQQPHLNLKFNPQDLKNPSWTDDTGQELEVGVSSLIGVINTLSPLLGTKRFTRDVDIRFRDALGSRIEPNLNEELLSDSQTAYFEGNLRRAILELAISCEIMVKQFYFSNGSIVSSIFDYLEDKSRYSIKVTELIGPGAKRVFGVSFKDTNKDDYQNIDHLFRCRNKVAHRGEIKYRDDGGNLHDVDKEEFQHWWNSIDVLKTWLESQRI